MVRCDWMEEETLYSLNKLNQQKQLYFSYLVICETGFYEICSLHLMETPANCKGNLSKLQKFLLLFGKKLKTQLVTPVCVF